MEELVVDIVGKVSSTRPRAWLTVMRLAVSKHPGKVISFVAALLVGKRVRAWNGLTAAAANHPRAYAAWVRKVEPLLLPRPDATRNVPGGIAAIVIGMDHDHATERSIAAAFGTDVTIFTEASFRVRGAGISVDWILPIFAGDEVSPELGRVLAQRITCVDAHVVYWDEDIKSKSRSTPWLKPDWDPILFGVHDGLIGSCILKSDFVPDVVSDWSGLARTVANGGESTVHVPLILTHRLKSRSSTVGPRVPISPVSVSIIIPTRDRVDLLQACLDGLWQTRFPGEYEIIVVDNDSEQTKTKEFFAQLELTGTVRVIAKSGSFNFAALSNAGVTAASGTLICLLNNDIEFLEPDWLERMAELAICETVGAVGARLLYPDGSIQHAGVVLGIGDAAGHVSKGEYPIAGEFAPWHGETRTVSAVTAACLLVDREKYIAVGGMDERTFTVDFNDVDLCLRLARRGWRTVYCASATLIHHESKSRGSKRHGTDRIRFERELDALRTRWNTVGMVDPYHNSLFRRQSEQRVLAF